MTLDEIEAAIRSLSHAECACLFERFNLIPLGILAGVDQTIEVTIEDRSQDKPPIAIVKFNDGSKKAIDIIATVQKDPKSIGHPVIRIAIWRWTEILRHHRALNFKDAYDERWDGFMKDFNKNIRGRFPEIAAKNLDKIHMALRKATEGRAILREEAFKALVQFNHLDKEDTYLYEAYEWLRQDKTRNEDIKLENLEAFLKTRRTGGGHITIERVMDFLRDEIGYIKPRGWPAMLNAFIAWFFNLDQYTVKRYFSTAKTRKNEGNGGVDDRFLLPGLLKKYMLSEAGNRFSLPLVLVDLTDEVEDEETEGQLDSGD